MQVLGHYFFEDSPEVKAWKIKEEQKRKAEIILGCEREWKNKKFVLGQPIAWHYQNLDMQAFAKAGFGAIIPCSDEDNFKIALKEHRKLERMGECHKFDDTLYCYHLGKTREKKV